MKYGLAQLLPEVNFCNRWSGALGFLDDGSSMQEIAIQLTTAYPCCPGTVEPLGDLAQEPIDAMLDRHRGDPVWEALNGGDPEGMGLAEGFDREHAARRIRELGSICPLDTGSDARRQDASSRPRRAAHPLSAGRAAARPLAPPPPELGVVPT